MDQKVNEIANEGVISSEHDNAESVDNTSVKNGGQTVTPEIAKADDADDNGNVIASDKMFKAIGEIGIWQILILIVASIPSKMSAIWQQMAIIFVAPKTTFWCTDLAINETISNSTCYKNCSQYEYYSDFDNTIISEWDLICGRAWLANFTQSVCMFGVLVGSAAYGFMSDRYGRRPALLTAAMTQMVAGMMIPFAPDFWTFTALRFIVGTSTAGIMMVSFVIVLEIGYYLLRIPSLRVRNLCSCVIWFILGLSFYGGNQYIGQTSKNAFLSIVLAGAFQIPGLGLSGLLCKWFGRKNTVLGFCLLCGVSNGLLMLPDSLATVKLVAGATAVSCAAGGYGAMYTFTSELFPTVVRNMAVGASSTASRVGSMLAPFVGGAGAHWVAPAVFAAAPGVAAVAVLLLPETKGVTLLNHLDEC